MNDDFILKYQIVILKEQTKNLKMYMKRKQKYDKTIQELALTPQHTTQRYWQSVRQAELCIEESEKLKNEMNWLNHKTGWKKNLHQERFSFITDEVLKFLE